MGVRNTTRVRTSDTARLCTAESERQKAPSRTRQLAHAPEAQHASAPASDKPQPAKQRKPRQTVCVGTASKFGQRDFQGNRPNFEQHIHPRNSARASSNRVGVRLQVAPASVARLLTCVPRCVSSNACASPGQRSRCLRMDLPVLSSRGHSAILVEGVSASLERGQVVACALVGDLIPARPHEEIDPREEGA